MKGRHHGQDSGTNLSPWPVTSYDHHHRLHLGGNCELTAILTTSLRKTVAPSKNESKTQTRRIFSNSSATTRPSYNYLLSLLLLTRPQLRASLQGNFLPAPLRLVRRFLSPRHPKMCLSSTAPHSVTSVPYVLDLPPSSWYSPPKFHNPKSIRRPSYA